MNVINKKITELIPYEKNTKKHDKTQINNVAESIKQYGFVQPLVIDKDNVVVIGHCRLLAAKQLGMEEVPCVCVDDLTEEQVRALRIVDNKSNESEWDFDFLSEELAELDLGDFDFDFGIEQEEEETEIIEDEAPEVDEENEPICKLGDIWQLGRHRLMCGDSTDIETVELLMDGEKADMVFTDPPYNVDYGDKNTFFNEADEGNRIQENIKNDNFMNDEEAKTNLWLPAFSVLRKYAKKDCSLYVTMPQGGAHMMMMMMSVYEAGWQVKHELVWVKNNHVLGRVDYLYKHEPILYGWNEKHKFYGKGKFTKSVWEIPKPSKSDLHPTMKPIGLIENALLNSTIENDIVCDIFGGSGSTLIACEQLDRTCYMMELDPRYVQVILERYIAFKGTSEDVYRINADGTKTKYADIT